jgi:hypothetical protein
VLLEIKNIIKAECERQKITDIDLIVALTEVESGGNPKVARFEKQFAYLWKDLEFSKLQKITQDTERLFQKTSWGPMQIMGGTARWLGYSSWLPDLCDPRIGILWGCMYFKKVCDRHIYLNDKISCYNAGTIRRKEDGSYQNQQYVNKVLDALGRVESANDREGFLS